MTVADTIRSKLMEAFSPQRLDLVDESDRHLGHAGHRPEGETHFRAEIVSSAFERKTRVERQRMVYAVLAEELSGRVHALALKTATPDEDAVADNH